MAGGQKSRQRAIQRAKAERVRAAQQRAAERRRRFVTAGVIAVTLALVVVLVLALTGGDKKAKTDVAAANSSTTTPISTTTTAAVASAAGKPCVKVADPLPSGAPDVPVQAGPPPTKLIMQDLAPGTGAVVPAGATVTVNYIGVACTTGRIFDSSYKTGQPATFSLGGVIPGWTQGIPGMKVGGRRLLGIPAALAYGSRGQGADIGPDEPLWFVVEVLATK